MNNKFWLKLILSVFKITVFILACYFIYVVIQDNIAALKSIDIRNSSLFIATLLISIMTYVVLMMGLVFGWQILLQFKDPKRSAAIYFKSQILKYLPGNVLHFAYRHQQTKNENFTHKQLGIAAVYESAVLVMAALIVAQLLFLWPEQITWVTSWLPLPFWSIILIEFVSLIVAFHMLKKNRLLILLLIYMIYFAGMGWITYLLITAMGFETQAYLFITACFAASWLAGYVIPGAPGGTGVRELVFILLCSPIMAEYEGLIVIALIRLISITAEILIYFIASILSQPYRHFSIWSDKTMP